MYNFGLPHYQINNQIDKRSFQVIGMYKILSRLGINKSFCQCFLSQSPLFLPNLETFITESNPLVDPLRIEHQGLQDEELSVCRGPNLTEQDQLRNEN